jgi:hypothetical protein
MITLPFPPDNLGYSSHHGRSSKAAMKSSCSLQRSTLPYGVQSRAKTPPLAPPCPPLLGGPVATFPPPRRAFYFSRYFRRHEGPTSPASRGVEMGRRKMGGGEALGLAGQLTTHRMW